jgi:hypothetical protein
MALLSMAVVLTTALPQIGFAQTNQPSGMWKLNVTKSQFNPGPAPRSSTVTFEAAGQGFAATNEIVDALSNSTKTVTNVSFDGKPNEQYKDFPEHIRSWFKSIQSPKGAKCCDIADGHYTDYEMRSDGYWVPIKGESRHVPPEAIVFGAGNPAGEAVVWYVYQGGNSYYIRRFVPAGGA